MIFPSRLDTKRGRQFIRWLVRYYTIQLDSTRPCDRLAALRHSLPIKMLADVYGYRPPTIAVTVLETYLSSKSEASNA